MSAEERPLLSVIIPVYNEAGTIEEILGRVAATPHDKEIVVVDDASTDGSRELLESVDRGERTFRDSSGRPAPVRVLFQPQNRGKGAALRRGFEAATGRILLVQDADLEYDPNDYAVLLRPILDGQADVVYGSRFLGGPQRVLLFWHYLGNRTLTLLSNMLTNLNLTDMETCYKVFRREVLDGIGTLRSVSGYSDYSRDQVGDVTLAVTTPPLLPFRAEQSSEGVPGPVASLHPASPRTNSITKDQCTRRTSETLQCSKKTGKRNSGRTAWMQAR